MRAIRITSRLVANERALRRLISATARILTTAGAPADAAAACRLVTLHHDQLGDGYGRETATGRTATDVFAAAGLRLDATYTAKAAADVLAAAEAGARPLFIHTLSASEPLDRARDVRDEDLPHPFSSYVAGNPV